MAALKKQVSLPRPRPHRAPGRASCSLPQPSAPPPPHHHTHTHTHTPPTPPHPTPYCPRIQSAALDAKLAGLRGGAMLVSQEDVSKVEKVWPAAALGARRGPGPVQRSAARPVPPVSLHLQTFARLMDAWTKNKRIFRSIWDTVSENIDGKQARASLGAC